MVRCAPRGVVGALSYDFAAVANVGAADLLVCARHRDLLRLQHLPLQTRSSPSVRGNRLVACAEDRRDRVACLWLARRSVMDVPLPRATFARPARLAVWRGRARPVAKLGRTAEPHRTGGRPRSAAKRPQDRALSSILSLFVFIAAKA